MACITRHVAYCDLKSADRFHLYHSVTRRCEECMTSSSGVQMRVKMKHIAYMNIVSASTVCTRIRG